MKAPPKPAPDRDCPPSEGSAAIDSEASTATGTTHVTASIATATLGPKGVAALRRGPELARGESLGRYLVLEPVGRGGMGQVYAAYDPKLDRKVALKVLLSSKERRHGARLIREARALARLSHANVVSVFDAEIVDDRLFIATEFIVGHTFSEWLELRERTPSEILETLQAAGKGLAAAHSAGLVHRDFKGSNVMVAEDGRVVVLDFGLARQLDEHQHSPADAFPLEVDPADVGQAVTRAGALLGTPAFMAPEQRSGEAVGPAADQYSFCTVAYQALTGNLPAQDPDGDAAAALRPGVRRLLEQGLAPSPTERHPSMAVLLDKLHREVDSTRRRRQRLVAGLCLLGLLMLSAFSWRLTSAPQAVPCSQGEELFAEVWNPLRRGRVKAQLFDEVDGGGAASSAEASIWQAAAAGLGGYRDAWVDMHREACRATHLFGRQSEELLDLRMDCLDQRLGEVDAALETLGDGTPGRLGSAPRLISHLPSLAACRDTRALRSPTPPPDDPDLRLELDRLRHGLAKAKALWLVGDYVAGRELTHALSAEARELAYWPLTAEILLEHARFLESLREADRADDALVETLMAAQAGGHARVAAEALVRRVRVLGYLMRQGEDADTAADQARGVLERLSEPALLNAELDGVRGLLAVQAGELHRARVLFESALETQSALYGSEHLSLAPTLSRLADVALEEGRLREARPLLEQALAINRRHLGNSHPNVAGTLAQLGMLAIEHGDFESALVRHSEALQIRRGAYGDDHVRVAMSLSDLANAQVGLGRFNTAVANYDRALELFEERLGADHSFVAITASNLAAAHIRRSQPDLAVPLYQRALDIQRRSYDQGHLRVLQARFNLAEALRRAGQIQDAISKLELLEPSLPGVADNPSPLTIDVQTSLGEAYLESGRPERARSLLARSLEARARDDRRPDLWAKNAFALARALTALDREPERATELARSALEQYRGGPFQEEAERVERWLALHDGT